MNLSKHEQRVLHILAQGGEIHFDRLANGKLGEIICYTREGYVWAACDTMLLRRLIQRRFVKSRSGKPYKITKHGLTSVRAQLDNR